MNKLKGGMIGEILEQGGSIVKQTAKTVKSQVAPSSQKEKSQNEEIVKSLYEKSDSQQQPSQTVNEEDKLAQTRNELQTKQDKKQAHQQQHDITYYNPTFNLPKKEEPRPAEKVEQEQQQEMQELQQKEAKKPPRLAVKRAQNIEKFRGVSG